MSESQTLMSLINNQGGGITVLLPYSLKMSTQDFTAWVNVQR